MNSQKAGVVFASVVLRLRENIPRLLVELDFDAFVKLATPILSFQTLGLSIEAPRLVISK